MDLLILAAGMGSRFGGLKQAEPMDEYGNFIIDYSIYDAIKAGFDRIVFIIKEENYDLFKSTVGKRIESKIKVEYAFQSLSLVPEGIILPKDRVKPLGTAQAILSAKDIIDDKFLMINSDDFYGYDAFKVAHDYLASLKVNSKAKYANIAFNVKNTLSETGSVKRGILLFDENNKLKSLVESNVRREGSVIYASPLEDENREEAIDENTLVSMNMFAFTKDIMEYLDDKFLPFFKENMDNLKKCEYLIPTVVSDLINEGKVSCDVLSTSSVWYGVTYKEDKEGVVKSIKKLVDDKNYPEGVWK
ncbi:MAG: nucleotidyltransferase [Gammaproteobacteria bacterium]|nr:nucleotidyltransferase [Gammaproteobacteria bacterium]